MKKKLILLIFTLIFSIAPSAFADKPIGVLVDDKEVSFDVPPINENGRVLVPLRAISEALNAVVAWDGDTSTVVVFNGTKACLLTIDNNNVVMFDNGSIDTVQLDVPPTIRDDRTLLPVRFFAEFFGCNVDWQEGDSYDNVVIKTTQS